MEEISWCCRVARPFAQITDKRDLLALLGMWALLGGPLIAVCFSCDELINSIGLSGLHPTLRVPARPEPEGP